MLAGHQQWNTSTASGNASARPRSGTPLSSGTRPAQKLPGNDATREARVIRIKQTSGTAVSMALRPSRGIRDDIIFSGGKPKDHNKENYLRLKEMQRIRKQIEEERAKPAAPPFKLKQFDGVPSRLSTRRSDTSGSNSPFSSRPSSSGSSRLSAGASATSSQKNFIRLNAMRATQSSPPSKSPPTPERDTIRRSTPIGELPRYLKDRKTEWAEQERQRALALERERIPKGMRLMEDEERLETLEFLRQSQQDLLKELSKFGLVVESAKLKRRRAELEEQLKEVEEAIDMFSRRNLFVQADFNRSQESEEDVDDVVVGLENLKINKY